MRYSSIYCGLVLGVYGGAAAATPFVAMDPRSMGMGGASVASANASHAPLYNPALLATEQDAELFSLEIPVAVLAADPNDLLTAATDFGDKKLVENFDNSTSAYDRAVRAADAAAVPTPTQIRAVAAAQKNMATASKDLVAGVKSLSDKAVTIDANAGVVLSVPSKSVGMALVVGGWASGGVVGEFAASDEQNVNGILDIMDNVIVAGDTITIPTGYTAPEFTPDNNLTSNFQIRAALVKEVGVTFAQERSFFDHSMAIGITPKFMQVSTFDYKLSGQNLSDPNVTKFDKGQKDYNSFNIDIGVAKEYGENWKTGLSVKNLIPMTYKTTLDNDVKIGPAVRIGGAYHNNWVTGALDFDLTENQPAGFGAKSRYLALGGELDVWLLKLRAGYQYNISDSDTSIATAGLGLNLFGLHTDIGAGIGKGGVTASAQLGFTW